MMRPDFIQLKWAADMQLRHNFAYDDVTVIIVANSEASVTAIAIAAAVICSAASALKSDSAFWWEAACLFD